MAEIQQLFPLQRLAICPQERTQRINNNSFKDLVTQINVYCILV